MSIVLKINGKERTYEPGITFGEIASEYREDYDEDIVLVRYNDVLKELIRHPGRNGTLEFVTRGEKAGNDAYRRSLLLTMQSASDQLFPELFLRVQHSVGHGYYCEYRDSERNEVAVKDLLGPLNQKMKEMVEADLPIHKNNVNVQEAIARFREWGRTDKVKLLKYRRNPRVNLYDLAGYQDYYYGYMLPSTGYLKYFGLEPYQNGFMLLLPSVNTKKIESFVHTDKLFETLDTSAKWGEKMGIRTVGELNEQIAQGRMQDIILIQEAFMEQQIGDIAEQIAADDRIKFVMIAGPSSSGKTTFSHRLSIQLAARGLTPHPISLDDFYVNREDTPRDEFGELDFECLEAIDIECFNQCMEQLLSGEKVILPVYNFKTGRREYRTSPVQLGNHDVLVIEGIHGLNEKMSYRLAKENKFKIYISALTQLNIDEHNRIPTTDGRLLRRMVRDARTRNTTARETLARWDSVRRGEEKNIFPYQEEADVMFNSALIYELSVLKLYAEPLLFAIEPGCPEYEEARRLLRLLDYFLPVPGERIAYNSILREFIGNSMFRV